MKKFLDEAIKRAHQPSHLVESSPRNGEIVAEAWVSEIRDQEDLLFVLAHLLDIMEEHKIS